MNLRVDGGAHPDDLSGGPPTSRGLKKNGDANVPIRAGGQAGSAARTRQVLQDARGSALADEGVDLEGKVSCDLGSRAALRIGRHRDRLARSAVQVGRIGRGENDDLAIISRGNRADVLRRTAGDGLLAAPVVGADAGVRGGGLVDL